MLSFKSFIIEGFYLLEDRLDYLEKKYPIISIKHDHLAKLEKAKDIIQYFAENADPTFSKKYTDWIIIQYKNGNVRQEDAPRIHATLKNFDKFKSKLKNKDINFYKHLDELEQQLESHLGTKSNREVVKEIKHKGADKVLDKNDIVVYKIKNKEAACYYGKGTKWCTAADNYNRFDSYNNKGPLYIIFAKDMHGKLAKYQFHFETDSYMDENDRSINLEDLVKKNPELKEVPNWQGKSLILTSDKNFGKYFNVLLKSTPRLTLADPRTTQEFVNNALNSPDYMVKFQALDYDNISKQQLSMALNDPHESVRYMAIVHPNITKALLLRASEDYDKTNKDTAKKRLSSGDFKQ